MNKHDRKTKRDAAPKHDLEKSIVVDSQFTYNTSKTFSLKDLRKRWKVNPVSIMLIGYFAFVGLFGIIGCLIVSNQEKYDINENYPAALALLLSFVISMLILFSAYLMSIQNRFGVFILIFILLTQLFVVHNGQVHYVFQNGAAIWLSFSSLLLNIRFSFGCIYNFHHHAINTPQFIDLNVINILLLYYLIKLIKRNKK